LKKNPLVIMPAGSVEQHGPHLPTGTDIYASNVIGHAVAERMDALVLPGGPLGVTPMHMPFEGTITLSPETYQRVVVETCESTAKHGAKRLLILNWHEGNIPSLALASEKLHREVGMNVIVVQACYVAAELYGHECGGLTHGGEIEALAVLAYRPDLVHLDRIDYSSDHTHGRKWDKLRRTRSYQPVLRDIAIARQAGSARTYAGGERPPHGGRHRRCHRARPCYLPSARCGAGRHRGNEATRQVDDRTQHRDRDAGDAVLLSSAGCQALASWNSPQLLRHRWLCFACAGGRFCPRRGAAAAVVSW
jgi:creatinine amidohydrolase